MSENFGTWRGHLQDGIEQTRNEITSLGACQIARGEVAGETAGAQTVLAEAIAAQSVTLTELETVRSSLDGADTDWDSAAGHADGLQHDFGEMVVKLSSMSLNIQQAGGTAGQAVEKLSESAGKADSAKESAEAMQAEAFKAGVQANSAANHYGLQGEDQDPTPLARNHAGLVATLGSERTPAVVTATENIADSLHGLEATGNEVLAGHAALEEAISAAAAQAGGILERVQVLNNEIGTFGNSLEALRTKLAELQHQYDEGLAAMGVPEEALVSLQGMLGALKELTSGHIDTAHEIIDIAETRQARL